MNNQTIEFYLSIIGNRNFSETKRESAKAFLAKEVGELRLTALKKGLGEGLKKILMTNALDIENKIRKAELKQ